MPRTMLIGRPYLGRPARITTAPGPLGRLLLRLGAWLDAYHERHDVAALALPAPRSNPVTLRPWPGDGRVR